jgi:magnesium transporter
LGLVAWGWEGNLSFGIVVGGALGINLLVGATVGGILPLIAKRCGFDPALVSGLLLTTITDVVGFFMALFFAAQMLASI